MRNALNGVWITCFFVWACISAAPCIAQAPDQGATDQVHGLVAQPLPLPPGMRPWGPEQATGAPDTDQAGDIPTAWASLDPDGGVEWLRVDFDQAVIISEVRIRESFNPGAVSKVAAILQDGKERVLWEGFDPTADAPADFAVQVDGDIVGKSIKVYLDTTQKEGWNEIDAVELVGKDGKRQWASHASASSTYAVRTAEPVAYDVRAPGPIFGPRMPGPFASIGQKRVIVHLEGDKTVAGTFVRATDGFIVIEQPDVHKTVIVNLEKMVYLETAE